MDTSQSSLLEGSAYIFPGQAVYAKLDADVVRNFIDSSFAKLANCPDADFLKGYGHRWEGGHDLLVDVPKTLVKDGWLKPHPIDAFQQVGHIVLTDLPTKAGIPIPGLSGSSSLGEWLVEAGIPKGYLSIHWADGAFGFLAISEGSTDIIQAIHGSLAMNSVTLYDTFAEGGAEIALALAAKSAWGLAAFNPAFAIFGGVENILAGIISVYQTASVYVDPLVFFGSAGTSAMIGFGLAYGLAGESLSQASIDSIRGGTVGTFFSLSTAFGYGALAGFVSYKLGSKLAKIHNDSMRAVLTIDDKAYELLLDELCKGNVHLAEFLDRAETRITFIDNAATLSTQSNLLDANARTLSDKHHYLGSGVKVLAENRTHLKSSAQTLADDSPILADWYRSALAH